MIELKYIATGTGRCGTVFLARLLTSLGIPCSHESIFDYHGWNLASERMRGDKPMQLSYVSTAKFDIDKWVPIDTWLPDLRSIQAESSYMAAPFLAQLTAKVIHVVRNPIRVVTSFCNYVDYFVSNTPSNGYEEFIYQHLPELKMKMPQYDRACLYYILWNKMISEKNPQFFYKIEDLPNKLLEEWKLSGVPFRDTKVNSLRKPGAKIFCIDDVDSQTIRRDFVELGQKYGYSMDSEYFLI